MYRANSQVDEEQLKKYVGILNNKGKTDEVIKELRGNIDPSNI